MSYQIDWRKGVSNRGNQARLKKLMKAAEHGAKLTIGFIGGSITQGSLATAPERCYAYHVFEWWKQAFPSASFTYVNAGIGGTSSQFGAARANEDLLSKQPDFAIIEFSVNDDSDEHFLETYEGVVRKIYGSETKPAVLLVHNVFYNTGGNAQFQHAKIGRHYDLPGVSMQSSIYPEIVSGRIMDSEITPDDLHPNDEGHALVASVITGFLEDVRLHMSEAEEEEPEMPKALTQNSYEHSVRFRNDNSAPICEGFTADPSAQTDITDWFKRGWTAEKQGASITFEAECSGFSVQYRKTREKPAPVAKAVVDGDESGAVFLDAGFDEVWGDKLELTTITEHMEYGMHRIVLTLDEAHEDDALPFYLVSVIAAK